MLLPLLLTATAASAAPLAFDATPWLEDLQQLRTAIDRNYPNRDWLIEQREVSLDRWFEQTTSALQQSRDEYDARRAMERLVERFNDGHMGLVWPKPAGLIASGGGAGGVARTLDADSFCAARGYDAGQVSVGTAAAIPGYLPDRDAQIFRRGTVKAAGRIIGVLRIGVFSPEGYPQACKQALANAKIAVDKPCDDACEDQLLTEVYSILTHDLIAATERLRAVEAEVLLVDLTRNGGGTDWAEAAARIVSPVPLKSARLKVLRSDEMADRWNELADKLRKEALLQSDDRVALTGYAEDAATMAGDMRPCASPTCSHLVDAGFTTGLLPELPANTGKNADWVSDVFGPAQFPYRASVWQRPVIVLVDDETWSAAEQFAALLRDNDAAIVLGTRTGGAGCGHLYGNNPVVLKNSKAQFEMPNCARLRRDGSNEVSGIVPDVSTGVRWNDGPAFAGRLTAARLLDAVAQAEAQANKRKAMSAIR